MKNIPHLGGERENGCWVDNRMSVKRVKALLFFFLAEADDEGERERVLFIRRKGINSSRRRRAKSLTHTTTGIFHSVCVCDSVPPYWLPGPPP